MKLHLSPTKGQDAVVSLSPSAGQMENLIFDFTDFFGKPPKGNGVNYDKYFILFSKEKKLINLHIISCNW